MNSSVSSNFFIPEHTNIVVEISKTHQRPRIADRSDYICIQDTRVWSLNSIRSQEQEQYEDSNQNIRVKHENASPQDQAERDLEHFAGYEQRSVKPFLEENRGSALQHWVVQDPEPEDSKSPVSSPVRKQLTLPYPDQGWKHAPIPKYAFQTYPALDRRGGAGDSLHDLHEAYMRRGALASSDLLHRRSPPPRQPMAAAVSLQDSGRGGNKGTDEIW